MNFDRLGWPVRLLLFFTVVGTAACSFPAAAKRERVHTYVLSPERPPADGRGGGSKGGSAVLLVNLPEGQSGFDTERIAYLRRPHEVSYYAESEWAAPPARMLAPLLVRALEGTRLWRAVVRVPSAVRGDYRIDSDQLSIAQEFFQRPSRIRLTLRAELIDLQRAAPIGTKRFEIVEEAPSDDAYGGVLAANLAVAKLLEALSEWLGRCVAEGGAGGC